jgi:parallel beta-helix repeat protein
MFSVHYAADVRVEGSRFAHNVLGDDTVRFACCDNLILRDVVVEGANGDGIDCDLSTGSIVDTRVLQPHNDGIDLMTAVVHLTGVQVEGSGDKGISLGESADPEVRDCSLVGCNIGIAIKDASDPRIFDTEVRGCQVGIGSYDKNWRYPGGGRGHMQGCRLLDNVVDVQLDASSQLILENCQTTGRFVLPPGRENSLEIVGAESMP